MKSKWFLAIVLAFAFLVQDSSQEISTEVTIYFDYTNQFMLGFRASNFVPDVFSCINNLQTAISDFNTSYTFTMTDPNYLWFDYTFNWTEYISGSFSDAYQYCALTSLETYDVAKYRATEYDNFTDFLLAFLQNMLGNVVSFQRIYDKMITALEDDNLREFFYQVGRLFNLLYDFEPIDYQLLMSTVPQNQTNSQYPILQNPLGDVFGKLEEDVQPAEIMRIFKGSDVSSDQEVRGIFEYSSTLNYFEVSYYVFYGFVNSTIGFNSMNSTQCLDIMKNYYYNTTLEIPWQVKGSYWKEFSLQTSYYFRNVDPLVVSCLWSVDETIDSLFDFGFTYEDYMRLVFNIIYHFGNMFDRVNELVQMNTLKMVAILSASEWIYVGQQLGDIFYQIFMPVEYGPVTIVYPDDSDLDTNI